MLPLASVAVQLTVVSPIVKKEPETGTHVTAGFGSTASVAVAFQLARPPVGVVASATTDAGTVSDGAVVSRTVTVSVVCDALPCASVAVQVTSVDPSANNAPGAG